MKSCAGLSSIMKWLALSSAFLAIVIPIYYQSTSFPYLLTRLFHSTYSLRYSISSDVDRPELSAEYLAFESMLKQGPAAEFDSTKSISEVVQGMRSSYVLWKIIPQPFACQSGEYSFELKSRSFRYHLVHHKFLQKKIVDDRILIYFHGGGHVIGDFPNYVGFECHISALFNLTVIHFEYERAPENSVPSIVEDAVAFYRHFIEQGISPSRIIIMGDSSGGGLTLLTIQSLIDQKLPKPRVAVVLSPWTDLTLTGDSLKRNRETDVMLQPDQFFWMVENILQIGKEKSYRHSPLFGSFKDFPPLYVTYGTAEILEDDATRVIEKAKLDGVDLTVESGKHLMHVYPLFFYYFPEARQSLYRIQQWIETKFE